MRRRRSFVSRGEKSRSEMLPGKKRPRKPRRAKERMTRMRTMNRAKATMTSTKTSRCLGRTMSEMRKAMEMMERGMTRRRSAKSSPTTKAMGAKVTARQRDHRQKSSRRRANGSTTFIACYVWRQYYASSCYLYKLELVITLIIQQ